MRKICLILLLSVLASNSYAEDTKNNLPPVLVDTLEKQFPDSEVFAYSPECKSDQNGFSQFGVVLGHTSNLHAMIATAASDKWVITDLPKNVKYSHGGVSDFLDEFTTAEAQKMLEVRCTNPIKDKDISTEANGVFIEHRGQNASAKHICFTTSNVYNSWVCYWAKPQTQKPELSFVQFNAD